MKLKIAILAVSLLCASCGPQVALKEFKDLPKDISVETIGNRVAEQLLAADPLDYGNNLPGYEFSFDIVGYALNSDVGSLYGYSAAVIGVLGRSLIGDGSTVAFTDMEEISGCIFWACTPAAKRSETNAKSIFSWLLLGYADIRFF